jgi:hypothetical protein
MYSGIALIRKVAEGVASLEKGVAVWDEEAPEELTTLTSNRYSRRAWRRSATSAVRCI